MEGAYDVPYEIRKSFSAPELNELINNFKAYDENKSGSIQRSELMKILKNLGHREVSVEDITTMMAGVDLNSDSELSLNEFLQLNIKLKGESAEETVVTVTKAGKEVVEKVSGGAKHSYSIEERECFSRVINNSLKDDPDCKEILPIDPDSDDLFKAVDNGVILCKLVNIVQPGTVDERVLNKKKTMSVFHVKENINLALASIRSIGCKVVSIDDELIMKRSENVILGLLWQIIRIILFKDINLKHVPELFRLLDEDKEEELNDLLALPIEDLLVRWLNYHLKKAGSDRKVDKIGKQLADSIVYATVLHQLDNDCINLNDVKNETDEKKRAKMVIDGATKLGVNPLIGPEDIVSGNTKLNTIFTADIFNHKHGLEELTTEQYEAAALLDDDIEGSKEERSFRMWMNSLGIENVNVNNLYEEARDGLILLKVIDRIEPGSVNWKRVEKNPGKNKIKRQINCAEVVEAATKMGCKIPGIDSSQILNGNKKAVLSIVWQIVRFHYLKLIGNDSEKDLVEWANKMISKDDVKVTSFKDKSLKTGRYLIELCSGIEPRAVNWDIVTSGESEEDRTNNAKYAISIARKLGATIFCVWDDIVKVNFKMILIFVCALHDVHNELKAKKKAGKGEEVKEEIKEEAE